MLLDTENGLSPVSGSVLSQTVEANEQCSKNVHVLINSKAEKNKINSIYSFSLNKNNFSPQQISTGVK